KIGIDLMECKNSYVGVIVGYFTRKTYTKILGTKHAEKILDMLKEVYKQVKFKSIISDCEKEFNNSKLNQWIKEMRIDHYLRPAYYHKSSGRVERVIRTLRTGLNKTKGPLKVKLKRVS